MKIKKKYRVLCIVLACVLLAVGIGTVYYHGEWWFPVTQRMRLFRAPDLTVTESDATWQVWSLDELIAAPNVTLSNNLLLVNSSHPLPLDYTPELVEYNGARMHPLMLDPYIALRDDVQEKTGVRIYVASDYRTAEEQAAILASSNDGVAAEIGCSEHEAGLALDVYAPYYGGINFLRSRAGREVNRVCGDYGYIIRYPSEKEKITGIEYEPWHIRYVGQPHATVMTESGLTLEEYVELFEPNVWYASGDYLISRQSPDTMELPQGWSACELSPDNTGYWFCTLRFD